jgi:hypothetical protein
MRHFPDDVFHLAHVIMAVKTLHVLVDRVVEDSGVHERGSRILSRF